MGPSNENNCQTPILAPEINRVIHFLDRFFFFLHFLSVSLDGCATCSTFSIELPIYVYQQTTRVSPDCVTTGRSNQAINRREPKWLENVFLFFFVNVVVILVTNSFFSNIIYNDNKNQNKKWNTFIFLISVHVSLPFRVTSGLIIVKI